MSKKNNQTTRRNLHAARLASASACLCVFPRLPMRLRANCLLPCRGDSRWHLMLLIGTRWPCRVAEEKEEAEKRKAKQEHKATRLAAADRMGVQAPKRLKKKAKKGVRIKKHVVVRVSGEGASARRARRLLPLVAGALSQSDGGMAAAWACTWPQSQIRRWADHLKHQLA